MEGPMDTTKSIYIRKSVKEDIPDLLKIFQSAKNYMRANKNFHQWNDNYPGEVDLLNDIGKEISFVGINTNEEAVMTFAFIKGEDPTYKEIYEGKWLNDEPYGTIHRIASNGKMSGVLKMACEFCFEEIENIRIDTHKDNLPMLKALENLDFINCGTIICRDGTPRKALQKKK